MTGLDETKRVQDRPPKCRGEQESLGLCRGDFPWINQDQRKDIEGREKETEVGGKHFRRINSYRETVVFWFTGVNGTAIKRNQVNMGHDWTRRGLGLRVLWSSEVSG